jgi:starch synthase (maltosyl-transferring)
VTVWGDLAEIDNAESPDRERLWAYWADLVRDSLEMGFSGFRCDAAYMVPAELWRRLIDEGKRMNPEAMFFAETLGASEDAVLALREAGFDYFFNSSKWWNFKDSWALDQHEQFGRVAPSISFPETHDTARLAGETDGDEAVQRQRYAFAAAFSAGVMMPVGYEFGFRKQVNVVQTMPSDWERKSFDLRPFITRVNRLKMEHVVLQTEGALATPAGLGADVLVLERRPREGGDAALVIVNTDTREVREVQLGQLSASLDRLRLHRICRDDSPADGEPVPETLALARAEAVYLLPD